MEAIVTATVNAAALLGKESDFGTLEVGKIADVIATNGSPLESIAELQNVRFVMKESKTYKQDL